MVDQTSKCPHCGTGLPKVQDAFCSECFSPLDFATPIQPVLSHSLPNEELDDREATLVLGLFKPANLSGIAITALSFLPTLEINRLIGNGRNGISLVVAGALALTLDLAYRFLLPYKDLLVPGRGGTLIFLPVWIWGAIWLLYGLWQVLG